MRYYISEPFLSAEQKLENGFTEENWWRINPITFGVNLPISSMTHSKLKFFLEKLPINRAVLIHYVQDLSPHNCGNTWIYCCLFGTHGKEMIWRCGEYGLNTCISLKHHICWYYQWNFLVLFYAVSLSQFLNMPLQKKLLVLCLQNVAWQWLNGLGYLYHYNMTSLSLQHSRSQGVQKSEKKVIIWGMRGSRSFHLHVRCAHWCP